MEYQEPNALMKPGIVVCGTIRDVKEDFLLFKRECVFLWIYALFSFSALRSTF